MTVFEFHKFLGVISMTLCFSGYTQSNFIYDDCFHSLRKHDFRKINCFFDKEFFEDEVEVYNFFQYNFLKSGSLDSIISADSSIGGINSKSPLSLIRKGDLILESGKGDEKTAYLLYINAYENALEVGNKIEGCEAVKRINKYLFKRQMDIPLLVKWSEIYEEMAYDDYERIYAGFFRVGTLMARRYYQGNKFNSIPFALELLREAEEKEYQYLIARLSQLIGVNYDLFYGESDKALFYYNKSLQLYENSSYFYSNRHINDLIFNIGTLEQERGNLKLALNYYYRINQDSLNSFDSKDLITINDYIYRNFKAQQKLDSALYYLERKYALNDSLDLVKWSNEISKAEAKYQSEKKERQILIEQQRVKDEQQKAHTNRNWLVATSVTLILGTGIAILLQKNTTKKRQLAEQEVALKQQRVENLLKAQELVSIDAMIAGQEKERQKVANELHDDLGSLMATVKLHFDNVKADEKDPALQSAKDMLEKAYRKIRGMAHAKNSGVMAKQGLLPAIRKMAKTISETNTLEISVEDFGLQDRMENSLELTIFRILQELTANIIKHADATSAHIQFTQHEDNLNIIVEDNGKGFDMSHIKRSSDGMGLGSIEKRIEALEGTFTVDSVLDKGTSIVIDIPV